MSFATKVSHIKISRFCKKMIPAARNEFPTRKPFKIFCESLNSAISETCDLNQCGARIWGIAQKFGIPDGVDFCSAQPRAPRGGFPGRQGSIPLGRAVFGPGPALTCPPRPPPPLSPFPPTFSLPLFSQPVSNGSPASNLPRPNGFFSSFFPKIFLSLHLAFQPFLSECRLEIKRIPRDDTSNQCFVAVT